VGSTGVEQRKGRGWPGKCEKDGVLIFFRLKALIFRVFAEIMPRTEADTTLGCEYLRGHRDQLLPQCQTG